MMVRKICIFLFLIGSALLLLRADCFAEVISSSELINNAKLYDGKIISYSGEAVGDIMARKEYAWINLNDGKNAIGIWIMKGLLKDLRYTGGYNTIGDYIEVTGIFHRSCVEHGGDLDIHAQSLIKINSGRKIIRVTNKNKINLALSLFAGLVILSLSKKKYLTK